MRLLSHFLRRIFGRCCILAAMIMCVASTASACGVAVQSVVAVPQLAIAAPQYQAQAACAQAQVFAAPQVQGYAAPQVFAAPFVQSYAVAPLLFQSFAVETPVFVRQRVVRQRVSVQRQVIRTRTVSR